MAQPWAKLYKTKHWQSMRLACFTRQQFACQMCGMQTHLTKDRRDHRAAVCDHIKAHKGDTELFFNPDNLQTLCKRCHDSTKQQMEKVGYDKRIGIDGWPVDANHPFNKNNNS